MVGCGGGLRAGASVGNHEHHVIDVYRAVEVDITKAGRWTVGAGAADSN